MIHTTRQNNFKFLPNPNGLWWKVTSAEVPRWMYSPYPEAPSEHNYSTHIKREIKELTPKCLEHIDDLPDNVNPLKIQPYPEVHNAVTGLYTDVGQDATKLWWRPVLRNRHFNIDQLKKEDDEQWEAYIKRYGYSPAEYMESPDYEARYGGPCDNKDNYVWSRYNYFRPKTRSFQIWYTRHNCFFPDSDVPGQFHRDPTFTFNRDPHFIYKNLHGTYTTNHPCPLCRDFRLQLNYRNVPLLKQFIEPDAGTPLPTWMTRLCETKAHWVDQSVEAARILGYMDYHTTELPDLEWDVNDYGETRQTMSRQIIYED